jgi:hypothetical protein
MQVRYRHSLRKCAGISTNDIPTARSQLRRFDRLAFAAAAGAASPCASPMLTRSSGAIPAIKESRNACRSSSFLMSACWSVLYCSTCMHSHADVGGSTAGTPSIFLYAVFPICERLYACTVSVTRVCAVRLSKSRGRLTGAPRGDSAEHLLLGTRQITDRPTET